MVDDDDEPEVEDTVRLSAETREAVTATRIAVSGTREATSHLDLKHICSPPSVLLNCPVASASEATATWRFTNFVLYCIVYVSSHTQLFYEDQQGVEL